MDKKGQNRQIGTEKLIKGVAKEILESVLEEVLEGVTDGVGRGGEGEEG